MKYFLFIVYVKVISRTGSGGHVYDFEVYTGKTGAETDNFGLGESSGFVMRLEEDIPTSHISRLQTFFR